MVGWVHPDRSLVQANCRHSISYQTKDRVDTLCAKMSLCPLRGPSTSNIFHIEIKCQHSSPAQAVPRKSKVHHPDGSHRWDLELVQVVGGIGL